MKNLLSKLSNRKRKMACPKCKQALQFPIKKNTTLRISCPNCNTKFDISFVNPLSALFKGQLKWKTLGTHDKLNLILFAGSLSILLLMIALHFLVTPPNTQSTTKTPPFNQQVPQLDL